MITLKRFAKPCFALFLACIFSLMPVISPLAVNATGAIATGVDVSKHNGAINWGAAAASGVSFAFIKVGSTNSGVDPQFASNITNAQNAGIRTGVYIYSYATNVEQAVNEANLVLNWINNYTVNFPVVYDVEDAVHRGKSKEELAAMANAFCATIEAAGYHPMVYASKNWFTERIGGIGYDKWVAQYNDSCEYSGNVSFWQSTSSANINGFNSRVDFNYQYKDYSSLIIPEGFLVKNGNTLFYRNWRMQRGWVTYADSKFYLNEAGHLQKGIWFTDAAGTYYLMPGDGSIARGQVPVNGNDYYFTADGVKTVGWITLNDIKYYYDPANDGIMKREWLSDATGNFYYFDKADGHMLTGGAVIDKAEYLFGADGIRKTGWAVLENGTFYYDIASGAKVRGWFTDEKGRYYLSADDGHAVTGPAAIEKKNYYFGADGLMVTGLVALPEGACYYDPAAGEMMFGWINAGDKTYYADQAGHIVTGLYPINKQNYYFDASGVLQRSQVIAIGEEIYILDEQGIAILQPAPEPAAVEPPAQ